MRVLAIHNYYQQRGGEDQCFEDEIQVLTEHGHQVQTYCVHNDQVDSRGKLRVAIGSIWNSGSLREVEQKVREFQPNIVHVMNAFPLLSPSVLYAAKRSASTLVVEVQNYRLFCPGTFLLRDGHHCQTCLTRTLALPAVLHRCYRGSLAGSLTLTVSNALHRLLKTWDRIVDLFICPSQAAKALLVQGGLPESRLMVKPNTLNQIPEEGSGCSDAFIFVGRLSPEKGLRTLLEAWQMDRSLPLLKIVGDGPDLPLVQQYSQEDPRIQALGKLPLEQVLELVGSARALIMPSLWNETFGRTTVESFSKGTPVIGSRIGGTAELIDEGQTGWLFQPGSASDLLAKLHLAVQQNEQQRQTMRKNARESFLNNFLPEHNYLGLMKCYKRAMELSGVEDNNRQSSPTT